MFKRWMFSTFFRDADNNRIPLCSAYGGQWMCPRYPEDEQGWALVLIACTRQQIDAADPEVIVLPKDNSIAPIPEEVVTAYASMGVVTGMSVAQMIAALSETEPLYEDVDMLMR